MNLNPLRERRDYGTQVRCSNCKRKFDYSKESEVSMGAIKCPFCKAVINQEGKVLHKRKASIIDYPRNSLCPQIWDVAVSPPVMKKEIRKKVLNDLFEVLSNNFKDYRNWITDISVTGSITTNLYNLETDVDINVSIDFDVFRKFNPNVSRHTPDDLELRNFIRDKVYILNGKKLAGDHPIKYFVIGQGRRLESDFIYDLIHNYWLIQPVLVDRWFDPDSEFFDAKGLALKIIGKIIPEIMSVRIHIIDLTRLQRANKDTSKMQIIVKEDIEQLKILKEKIKKLRLIRFKTKDIQLLSYAFSKNWEFFNIVSKYIEKYGFKNPIEFLKTLLTSEEKKILESQEKTAVIKRCPKKNLTDDRPKSEQQWCLYDSKGERLLGRHPTKEKALDQERVIQIHKHMK